MVKQLNVCVPSHATNPSGAQENKERQSHSHSGRPLLGQEVLVLGDPGNSRGGTCALTGEPRCTVSKQGEDATQQSFMDSASCLEIERQKLTNQGLSEQVVNISLASKRTSTFLALQENGESLLSGAAQNICTTQIYLYLHFYPTLVTCSTGVFQYPPSRCISRQCSVFYLDGKVTW